ncbi:MAG TPA: thiamine pyrophosphate-requiring protein, partial [Candidatus Binatia bacterium]|nr:thiamine pyrophosphate-requiring protein [Candidatus Binatia bacterium]
SMQAGPGAENAYSGITTAYSDSTPILLLPVGHARGTSQVHRFFRSVEAYASVTKWTEEITLANQVPEIMRRAFSYLKMGRPGPVLVEIPNDAAIEEFPAPAIDYTPVKRTVAGANVKDVEAAAKVLVQAKCPVIVAGQGVLWADATAELVELAELLQAPVTTPLEGKSAFPEHHPLSLGTGAGVMPRPVHSFLQKADVVFAIGASLTKHNIVAAPIPAGKIIIHATNDERDLNKHYATDYPLLGDAKPVLQQFIAAVNDQLGNQKRETNGVAAEIKKGKEEWMAEWLPKLTSNEKPTTPYRVMWEFMNLFDRKDVIVTHDAGSPRNQLVPFYQAPAPRSYLGWGKSHALGTGLGLIMGAKLAAPEKFCVNFMGDAAFGMTGLDFETAVRNNIPTLTIVLNNNFMAAETHSMQASHERYGTMNILGNYADLAKSLGGWSERVEDPNQIVPALRRAHKTTQDGKAALLEFITSREIAYSRMRD